MNATLRNAIHPAATALALAAGGGAFATGHRDAAAGIWLAGLVATGAPLVISTLAAARRGRFATDIVAMLAILAAVALRQPVAGLVIVLMQSGGEALERYAGGRASAAVRALEEAAPRLAHRMEDASVVDVPAGDVAVGDALLIRPGELVPTDGVVLDGSSELDTSPITGEAEPRPAHAGVAVSSGMVNLQGTFRMRATALADRSQYARIVDLVRSAQASKAPLQRVADRWAVWFTPLTIAMCAFVLWRTHDWSRVLAVLVVATPCPLLLAAPTAIVGGLNRAANRRIIVRNGGALETLSRVTMLVFDKTGTVTVGRPAVSRVVAVAPHSHDDVLRWADAAEHGSSHLLARVIGEYAAGHLAPRTRAHATDFHEEAGRGVRATVDGHAVTVGSRSFVASSRDAPTALLSPDAPDTMRALVAVDGEAVGAIEYADVPRPGLVELLARVRALGVRRLALLSGDHAPVVHALATRLGITDVAGDLLPEEKTAAIARMVRDGDIVAMVGDGTNDAPALSAAHVGIALGGHGGGIAAEAADVILLADDLDLVADAIAIARRTMSVARQSIGVGLGLSAVGMVVAATGHLVPVAGAVCQEAIDVAVILNALRAALPPRGSV